MHLIHYVKGGSTESTVNLCALDIAKAFDRVHHLHHLFVQKNTHTQIHIDPFALLKVLMDRCLPKNFIELLHDWLLKCYVCVRWGCAFSFWFGIQSDREVACPQFYLPSTWMF